MSVRIFNFHKLALILFSIIFYQKAGGPTFSFIPVPVYAIVMLGLLLINNKLPKIHLSISFYFFVLFLLSMFAGLIWTDATLYGINKFINVFVVIIISYFLYPILNEKIYFFLKVNFLLFCLYLINLYVEYGFLGQLTELMGKRFRLGWDDGATSFNPIGIARYLTFGFINIFFIFLYKIKRKNLNPLFLTFVICTVLIALIYLFFSGTKTPILALGVAISLFFLVNKYVQIRYKIAIVLAPIIIIVGFFSLITLNESAIDSEQMAFIEYRFLDSSGAIDDRTMQSKRALSQMSVKNIFLGSGTGDFGYLYTREDTRDYPHNLFMEVLYENGIFNLLFIVLFIFYLLINLRKSYDFTSNYCVTVCIFFIINATFSGDLINNSIVLCFAIFVVRTNRRNISIKLPSAPM